MIRSLMVLTAAVSALGCSGERTTAPQRKEQTSEPELPDYWRPVVMHFDGKWGEEVRQRCIPNQNKERRWDTLKEGDTSYSGEQLLAWNAARKFVAQQDGGRVCRMPLEKPYKNDEGDWADWEFKLSIDRYVEGLGWNRKYYTCEVTMHVDPPGVCPNADTMWEEINVPISAEYEMNGWDHPDSWYGPRTSLW